MRISCLLFTNLIAMIFTGILENTMPASTVMKVYYGGDLVDVVMNETMFLKFFQCMEDHNSEKCNLSLSSINQNHFRVTDVNRTFTQVEQQPVFTCQFNYEQFYKVVCSRSYRFCFPVYYCPNGTFDVAFKMFWTNTSETIIDTSHAICSENVYCSYYLKLKSTPITTTTPTTFTTTSTVSTEETTQSEIEIQSTWSNNFESHYYTYDVTSTHVHVNLSTNENLHTDHGQSVDIDTNIIIGSVLSAVFLIASSIIAFIVCRKRRLKNENKKSHTAKTADDIQLGNTEHIHSVNGSISSNQNDINNKAYDSTNNQHTDNYDQYNKAINFQNAEGNVLTNDSVQYSTAGDIQHDRPTYKSDKINKDYQNIKPVKSDSKDYARLGQDMKVFKHDYNSLFPDEEDTKLSLDTVSNVSDGSYTNTIISSITQNIPTIYNESTDLYSKVHKEKDIK